MTNKNITIKQLRIERYKHTNNEYPYTGDWRRNPYTWFKSRLYIEASAVLAYFLSKTRIKANTVTITYGLLGLVAGILLSIPANASIIIAILIFFFKGILDWSDGLLARIRGTTSVTGDILDCYGAVLGSLGLQAGLGFYVAQKSGMIVYHYLVSLLLLFYAIKITTFSYSVLFKNYLKAEKLEKHKTRDVKGSAKNENDKSDVGFEKKYTAIYHLANSFLDDRARTVDFVCLLILLEMFLPFFVTWVVFLGFLVKQFLFFCVSFYVVAKGGWVEKHLEDKTEEISRAFASQELMNNADSKEI